MCTGMRWPCLSPVSMCAGLFSLHYPVQGIPICLFFCFLHIPRNCNTQLKPLWNQSDMKDMSRSYRVWGSRKCNSLLCAFPMRFEMPLQSPLAAFSFSFVYCFIKNFIAVCSAVFMFRIIVSFVLLTFQSKAAFSFAPHISFALQSTLCYINSVIICCIWLIFLSLFCFELT